MADADRDRWADRAELAVSELVTNAILHAHTDLEVRVRVDAESVTVTVVDASPQLPAQRHWGGAATTGRGLGLVAALSAHYGVGVTGDGKQVWFQLDDTIDDAAADIWDIGAWEIDDLVEPAQQPGAAAATLVGVPVQLWLAAQQHQEAVLRELFLVAADQPDAVPNIDLAAAGRALAELSTAVDRGVMEAIERGAPLVSLPAAHPSQLPAVPATVDASVAVPADRHADFGALQDALDLGITLGAADRMLIRPPLPETVALRDWACEQVVAQANGVAATAWSGVAHPRFVDPASVRDTAPAPAWDGANVRASSACLLAVDDNNRVVALSAPAAQMLGWDVEDLTGRRVVTIIPERLREAHVAGFTRHLTTGESHVLGVPLELPVLRKDGTELVCRFVIDRAPANPGRAVYVAHLTAI